MTMPPTQDDLSARFDPTKLRARKFNTGRGAAAKGGDSTSGPSALWTETPEQKRKRLADEVMGVESKDERNKRRITPGSGKTSGTLRGREKDSNQGQDIAKKIEEHTVIIISYYQSRSTRYPSSDSPHCETRARILKAE